jgi:hypothetical protein
MSVLSSFRILTVLGLLACVSTGAQAVPVLSGAIDFTANFPSSGTFGGVTPQTTVSGQVSFSDIPTPADASLPIALQPIFPLDSIGLTINGFTYGLGDSRLALGGTSVPTEILLAVFGLPGFNPISVASTSNDFILLLTFDQANNFSLESARMTYAVVGPSNVFIADSVSVDVVTPLLLTDSEVSEPGTLALFGIGIGGLYLTRRRRKGK